MNISKRDKARALKFAKCKCKEADSYTYYSDYKECNKCGFKWDTSVLRPKLNKKFSKRDQLEDKE